MRGSRGEVEGTGVEEEGTALGPHYHGELGKADVVANAHPEGEAIGGLNDSNAEGEGEGEREGVVRGIE
jgi:hypothetical protein